MGPEKGAKSPHSDLGRGDLREGPVALVLGCPAEYLRPGDALECGIGPCIHAGQSSLTVVSRQAGYRPAVEENLPMEDVIKKKIALVGGAGFIGHHLALELVRRGADVHVIDGLQVNNLLSISTDFTDQANREMYTNMLQQRLELLRNAGVMVYPQDARDYHAMTQLTTAIKPEVIVHLAAVSHANRSNKDPYTTFDHSSRTLENALDNARYVKAHFVYLSSSMVYG